MGYSGFYQIEGKTYYPANWDDSFPANAVDLTDFRVEAHEHPSCRVLSMATAIFLSREVSGGTMIVDVNLLNAIVELFMYQSWQELVSKPLDKHIDQAALQAKIIDYEHRYQSLLPMKAIIPICTTLVGTKSVNGITR